MSVFALKILACISMVIDHLGAVVFPDALWMRYVGRLSFPIFAFLLAEGFYRTKNIKKYLFRMGIFALISEVPFDLALKDGIVDMSSQNVYFTLFLGLLMLYLIKWTNAPYLKVIIIVSVMAIAQQIHCDYRYPGIWMILSFALLRDLPMFKNLNIISANVRLFATKIQVAGALALIPIGLYNGKKGPSWKYFFYAFYPVHLLMIYFAKEYLIW